MKYFFDENLIIYICDNQLEVVKTMELIEKNTESIIIGKNRASHYYNYLFYQKQLKKKTLLATFDKSMCARTSKLKLFINMNQQDKLYYCLPEDYTEFIFKLLEVSNLKERNKKMFTCCGLEKVFIYFDLMFDVMQTSSISYQADTDTNSNRNSDLSMSSSAEFVSNHVSIRFDEIATHV